MNKLISIATAVMGVLLIPTTALAQSGAAAGFDGTKGALAAAIAIGLAAGLCGMGQGRAASAVLEGLSRNPGAYDKVFVPFILGMALIESLAIFGFVVALMALGKI